MSPRPSEHIPGAVKFMQLNVQIDYFRLQRVPRKSINTGDLMIYGRGVRPIEVMLLERGWHFCGLIPYCHFFPTTFMLRVFFSPALSVSRLIAGIKLFRPPRATRTALLLLFVCLFVCLFVVVVVNNNNIVAVAEVK